MKTKQQSKHEKLVKPSKGKQKVKASGSTISEAQRAHNATDQMVYIRVLYSDIDNTITNVDSSAPRHLYLIEGTLDDIARYAGDTVNWIIKVSDLICDPSGAGRIYTHTHGTPSYWYDRDRDANWRRVSLGDDLLSGIYEFDPNDLVTLSQICGRNVHSVTSSGATTSASTFRRQLEQRDVGCVVTRSNLPRLLVASRLVPKRVGDEGAKAIMERFVGVGEGRDIHQFHPSLGILLAKNLDAFVDCNEIGFYHETNDTYCLHDFTNFNLRTNGSDEPDRPLLHEHRVTLSRSQGQVSSRRRSIPSSPPPGVFDWHYLQCVLLRFATPQYRQLPGIIFFIYPYKTADDDSDDEFEDDVNDEPPYPSYRFDRIMTLRQEKLREQEQLKEVAQWASKVALSEG